MKKLIKNLSLIILFLSFAMPLTSVIAKPITAQATTNSFVCGITFGADDWDPPIYKSTPTNYYIWACLESLVWTDFDSVAYPVLATDWEVYPRYDEGGHTGGVKAISFTLRQNVKFHDGSEFNASVVKWNIDRNIAISGNLTGQGDAQNRDVYWFDASLYKNEFTENWNLTWALTGDPFGLGSEIPVINKTEVISNYLVNITFNSWTNSLDTFEGAYYLMSSKESYNNWTDTAIYGVGQDPEFPQDDPSTFPGHMIGTGPYMFDYIDEAVTATGHLVKNDNYWNKTALENDDLFSITDVYIRHYADIETRTTALLTGEADYLADLSQIRITDLDAVIADPMLNYQEHMLDPGIVDINFKCEEGLNTPTPVVAPWWGMTPKQIFPYISHYFGLPAMTPLPDGINRTIRRALSYSFDYKTYFDIIEEGKGNLSQSCLGIESNFYNPSVPEPYYNITKAREILLNDPYYGPLCTARHLSASNVTAEWNAVAESNPIATHDMIYNTGSNSPDYMEAALNDIGCGFIGVEVADIWQGYVGTGLAIMYDIFPFVWPNSVTNPWSYMNLFYTSLNRFIPSFGYNFNFMANDTIDQKFTDIYFESDKQADYDFIANHIQNYDVPMLYISQYMIGFAHNKGWTYTEAMPDRIGFSGLPYYAWIGGERATVEVPPNIPGYHAILVVLFSTFTILGTIYAIMRKKKLS
ncbi:MAG: ABC transporter substrate-binding protein [Promethearchaeota archaeon]